MCVPVQSFQYFGSKLLETADRLGSVRATQDTTWPYAWEQPSYYPYGEEDNNPLPDGTIKFATYLRDGQGLDYAMNRYYSSVLGRFHSPDPSAGADPSNPATWNQFAYVHGDPVNFNDRTGGGECAVGQPITSCSVTVTAAGSSTFSWDPVWWAGAYGAGTPLPISEERSDQIEQARFYNSSLARFLRDAQSETCRALPDGIVVGLSGSIAYALGATGSAELVFNMNTGQVSTFASFGPIGGYAFPGGTAQAGFIWGLGESNSSYKGPFTSFSIGAGIVSATLASSSGGFKNPFDLTSPETASVGLQTPGVATVWGETYYTNALNVGNLNDTILGSLYSSLFPPISTYYDIYKNLCGGQTNGTP